MWISRARYLPLHRQVKSVHRPLQVLLHAFLKILIYFHFICDLQKTHQLDPFDFQLSGDWFFFFSHAGRPKYWHKSNMLFCCCCFCCCLLCFLLLFVCLFLSLRLRWTRHWVRFWGQARRQNTALNPVRARIEPGTQPAVQNTTRWMPAWGPLGLFASVAVNYPRCSTSGAWNESISRPGR